MQDAIEMDFAEKIKNIVARNLSVGKSGRKRDEDLVLEDDDIFTLPCTEVEFRGMITEAVDRAEFRRFLAKALAAR